MARRGTEVLEQIFVISLMIALGLASLSMVYQTTNLESANTQQTMSHSLGQLQGSIQQQVNVNFAP